MGKQRILAVIAALQSAGFRAERGYPGKGMPYPDAPVVAVSLQEQTRERFTLAVRIYCAAPQGGIFCEDRAMDMVPVLENLGADCTVGACGFDGKSGLFSVCVQARWNTASAE